MTSIEEEIRSGAVRLVPVEATGDPHRFAVVSANLARPFLLGAYETLDAATKAQCGSPERWPIYERVSASPDHTPALLALIEERDRLKVEVGEEHARTDRWQDRWQDERDARLAAEAKCDALREAAIGAAAALAAAISLLERTPEAAKAAPSDRMFNQMLFDYRAALEVARRALTQETADV